MKPRTTRFARCALVLSIFLAVCACATTGMRTARFLDRDDWAKLRPVVIRIFPASGIWTQPLGEKTTSCPAWAFVYPSSHIEILGSGEGGTPGRTSTCNFTLHVTDGALRLPPSELEAAVAHELGHVALGHAKTRSDELGEICRGKLLMVDCYTSPTNLFRSYRPEHEEAADRYAADLLRKASSSGCAGLPALLRRLNARREDTPTQAHPINDSRLRAVASQCES
jgi:Zn-dependent protease with chaperone function